MNPYTDEYLLQILSSTRSIVVIGASPKEHRDSNKVTRFLIEEGYEVYPVNPGQADKTIHGKKVFASLLDIPETIDMVDIFRNKEAVPQIVEDAIVKKSKTIWMQLDIVHKTAAERAETAGLKVVMDRCPLIEIKRLKRNQTM